MNQSKHGKAGLNCFRKHVISKIWIGSTGSTWSSSGIFPGFTTLRILDEIQKFMTESKCESEQSKGRIIFMSMYDDIDWGKRGNKPIPPGQQVRQRLDQQQFEGLPQDGDTIFLPRRIRFRHHHHNQAATGSQLGAGIRGEHHPGLNSFFLLQLCRDVIFACRKFDLLAIDGGVQTAHLPRTTFSCTVVAQSRCSLVCQSVQSHVDPMHLHGSSHEAHCLRFAQKHTSSRNVVHLAALDDTKHGYSFPTFS